MADAALQTQDEIEIAQADVGIDQHDFRAAGSKRCADVGRGRRFPDSAFARRDYDRSTAMQRDCHAFGRRNRCGIDVVHVSRPSTY